MIAAAATGAAGCQSGDGDGSPTSERRETRTETATPTATAPGAETATAATAESTATETATPAATATEAATDWAAWPSFQRNARNWGHHPEAAGPHDAPAVQRKLDLNQSQMRSTPVLVDGTLYLGDGSETEEVGTLYALDPATGAERWTKGLEGPITHGLTVDGEYLFVGDGATVYMLRRGDGSEHWAFPLRSDATVLPPAVTDDAVYVATSSGRVMKLRRLNAERQWTIDKTGAITGQPIVSDGALYVTSEDDGVYRIAPDGSEEWSVDTDGDANGIALRDGSLFVTTSGGQILRLSRHGATDWTAGFDERLVSNPVVTDELVITGSRAGRVVAVDRDRGRQEWVFEAPADQVSATPAVADGTVYVGSQDRTVYGIDAGTGDQEWAVDVEGPVESGAPVVAGGLAFIGDRFGNCYAIGE